MREDDARIDGAEQGEGTVGAAERLMSQVARAFVHQARREHLVVVEEGAVEERDVGCSDRFAQFVVEFCKNWSEE